MSKVKKITMAVLLSCCLVAVSLALFINTNYANATYSTAQTTTEITMKEGASIRVSEPTGIRFTAKFSNDIVNELCDIDAETGSLTYKDQANVFGIVVVPTTVLTAAGNNDPIDYIKDVYGKEENQIAVSLSAQQIYTDNGDYYANGVIANIKDANYNNEYSAIAYYVKDGVRYFGTQSDSRSVAFVVNKALIDGETSTVLVDMLEKAINLQNGTLEINDERSSVINIKTELFSSITAEDFTVTSANGSVARVDGTDVTLVASGSTTLTVTAYGGKFSVEVPVTVTPKKYTVTWKNYDGSLLKEESVEENTAPSYTDTPTKPNNGNYVYTFTGWSPSLTEVVGDATYIAQYSETYVDGDTVDKVTYYTGWGGSALTARISVNTAAEGLCGDESTKSILIEDFDITGYNDFMWQMGGYTGFSADVKIVLSDNVSDTTVTGVKFTDESGNTLNAVEVNTWTKIFSATGNWGFMMTYPSLTSTDGKKISAKIYLDNVRFYTAADISELNAYRFANTSELTQIAGGDTSASDWKGTWTISIPNIVPSDEDTHHNHAVVINAKISDISSYDGISFAVNTKTWTGNNHHYFYIVSKANVSDLTAEKMDAYGQIQTTYETHGLVRVESYEATNTNAESGWQTIHIGKADLIAAGYKITDLSTVVIAFRNSVWNTDASLGTTGWAAIGQMQFCDFKVY